MKIKDHPPKPVHVAGISRGEEYALHKGKEPGRGGKHGYRAPRDSTGINAHAEEPIDPSMPSIPPA